MEYYNGIYEGEWKNGKREGFGIYKYNNIKNKKNGK